MYDECKLCGNYAKIHARKLCNICYELERKQSQVQNWNLTVKAMPSFLRVLGKTYGKWLMRDKKRLKVSAIKAIIKLIEYRKSLKFSMERTNITGLDLEHLVRVIMQRIRGINKKKVESEYFGSASFFDAFTPDQRVKLFRYLRKIHYLIPMPDLIPKILDEYQKL